MPVIKQSQVNRVPSEALALDLADLSRQAERIVGDARACAERIIDEARDEARRRVEAAVETARREAEAAGREAGHADGAARGRDEIVAELRPQLERVAAAWGEAVERWEADRREMQAGAREDVLAFAMALSRKVVHRGIAIDPSIVNDQVAEALALVNRPSEVEISVHPDDRALVEAFLPRITESIARCSSVRLCDDESMERGGCRVATAGGEIDATIETQLERIAAALLPASPAAPSPES